MIRLLWMAWRRRPQVLKDSLSSLQQQLRPALDSFPPLDAPAEVLLPSLPLSVCFLTVYIEDTTSFSSPLDRRRASQGNGFSPRARHRVLGSYRRIVSGSSAIQKLRIPARNAAKCPTPSDSSALSVESRQSHLTASRALRISRRIHACSAASEAVYSAYSSCKTFKSFRKV
jgi:hypothetical protein